MTTKTLAMIPAATVLLAASFASAQSAEVDTNGDGMYSFPELQAVIPEMTEDAFTLMDLSGDGLLDVDEIAAGTEAGLLPAMEG